MQTSPATSQGLFGSQSLTTGSSSLFPSSPTGPGLSLFGPASQLVRPFSGLGRQTTESGLFQTGLGKQTAGSGLFQTGVGSLGGVSGGSLFSGTDGGGGGKELGGPGGVGKSG